MSYLALARKWRPRTFSQLVGQEHINKALINALNQQRLHHAYLFTGTRGVGKTSVARILAKSLNCETGISSEPCLQCNTCISIEQGCFIDLIEIDGASKTRVEDTRDLLDNVQYAPATGRFKIYLIDEVHMLSQHSFNALLKTLEEPPSHVKFILATTDPQKLPVTVLSRCLQFNLKHLASELISQHLQLILKDEQLDYEPQALNILAHAARGSMRDALSLLDQAITSCDNQLTATDVKMILGYTQQDYALQLLQALANQDAPKILSLSQNIANEGGHFQYVLDELLNYLHQMAVYHAIGDHNALISPSTEIKSLSVLLSAEDVQLFYQISLKGREEIHLAPTLSIGFNMTLLRMLTFRPAPKVAAVAHTQVPLPAPTQVIEAHPTATPITPVPASILETTKINPSEAPELMPALAETGTAPEPTQSPVITTTSIAEQYSAPGISGQRDNRSSSQPAMIPTTSEPQSWAAIIPQLRLTGLALTAVENAELVSRDGRDLILRVARGHQSLFTPTVLARVETALSNYYQTTVKVTLNSDQSVQASPAQQKEQATQQKQQNAELALQNDPMFQQLQQDFSAELVKNSIVPLKDDL
ncbi:DNA polymerase III subunit gamma/tau [Legionella rowbothamii]|uniref:DNA polymerase III subunit gamma/tau n=1 Tax=Legionella rowbothamii TaxID=96229 RepID=UPI00105561A2|nr:DNA polymerase III subunit gamma/tau [Legionella rowbothamii]